MIEKRCIYERSQRSLHEETNAASITRFVLTTSSSAPHCLHESWKDGRHPYKVLPSTLEYRLNAVTRLEMPLNSVSCGTSATWRRKKQTQNNSKRVFFERAANKGRFFFFFSRKHATTSKLSLLSLLVSRKRTYAASWEKNSFGNEISFLP